MPKELKELKVLIVSGWFRQPITDWSMRAGSWLQKAGWTVLTEITSQDEADLIIIGLADIRWQARIKESNRRKTLLMRPQGWDQEIEREALQAGFGGLQTRWGRKSDFLRGVQEFVDQL